jgi:uncharacterized membrane protein
VLNRNAFMLLTVLIIMGLGSAEGLAHPPQEHEPVTEAQSAESPTAANAARDHHDEPGTPPHDHDDSALPSSSADAGGHDHHQAVEGERPTSQADETSPAHDHAHQGSAVDPCGGGDDHHAGPEGASGGHAHWGDHGPRNAFERALAALGVFHAVAVHFPIALILAAALAQAMNLVREKDAYADIVRFLVWTGALGGVAAGFLGWAHAGPMASAEVGVMLTHRWLGTGLAFGLWLVVAAVEWRRRNPSALPSLVLNISVFGAAAAVSLNGFLGGSLAHGGLRHLMGG